MNTKIVAFVLVIALVLSAGIASAWSNSGGGDWATPQQIFFDDFNVGTQPDSTNWEEFIIEDKVGSSIKSGSTIKLEDEKLFIHVSSTAYAVYATTGITSRDKFNFGSTPLIITFDADTPTFEGCGSPWPEQGHGWPGGFLLTPYPLSEMESSAYLVKDGLGVYQNADGEIWILCFTDCDVQESRKRWGSGVNSLLQYKSLGKHSFKIIIDDTYLEIWIDWVCKLQPTPHGLNFNSGYINFFRYSGQKIWSNQYFDNVLVTEPTPTPTPTVTPPPGEPGSSFDNPITIYKEGTVRDKLSEGETIYYKIWLNKDKDVTLTLDFGHNSNLDIYLCNPGREQVSASTGENGNAIKVDEQIEYNTGSKEGYYYIKIVNLHTQPHYEPEEFTLGVNVKSPLAPMVMEQELVLLGTYSLELSAPGSKIIDGKIGEIKVFGSSNKHRIEIELDTPAVRLYNAENRYLGDYDIPLTFHENDSVILLSFDEKVHMNFDGIAFYDSDGNQIEQGGGLLDALLTDIISIGVGLIIPVPIPTNTLGVLLESKDEMLAPAILSDDITHDVKSVVIAPKRGEVKKVVVSFSKGSDGTPIDNRLHLYVQVKGRGYPLGLSLGQYIPPIIVGTKYITDIPLVS